MDQFHILRDFERGRRCRRPVERRTDGFRYAAVLQFVLNGVGYIGVRRGHAVLEAEVLDGIHLEGERVTRVLVREKER